MPLSKPFLQKAQESDNIPVTMLRTMKRTLTILMMLVALLFCNHLCPVALGDQAQDDADDEAAYRALRGETAPEPKKTTTATGTKRSGNKMPTLSGAGPSRLNNGKAAGPFFLVKTDQFDGTKTYSLMTTQEVKKKKVELSVEGRKIASAYRLAAKEWKKTEKSKYPFLCPRPRQAQASKRYLDREKGEDKVSSIMAGVNKRKEARAKAREDKLKDTDPRRRAKIKKEIARDRKELELFVSSLAKLLAGEKPATKAKATAGAAAGEKKPAGGAVNLL